MAILFSNEIYAAIVHAKAMERIAKKKVRHLEEEELAAAINAFLARLPEADRKLFVARYWFLTPVTRLAEKLGCRPGSVKTRLYRLRLRLQEELRREGLV